MRVMIKCWGHDVQAHSAPSSVQALVIVIVWCVESAKKIVHEIRIVTEEIGAREMNSSKINLSN